VTVILYTWDLKQRQNSTVNENKLVSLFYWVQSYIWRKKEREREREARAEKDRACLNRIPVL
jgi:hypothetical protein